MEDAIQLGALWTLRGSADTVMVEVIDVVDSPRGAAYVMYGPPGCEEELALVASARGFMAAYAPVHVPGTSDGF
jgi:hypothetical protein